VSKKKMTEEDAINHIQILQNNWEKIGSDACDLHKIIVQTNGSEALNYWEVSQAVVDSSFKTIPDKIQQATSKVIKQIF
jgi:hypothetical protein